MAYQKLQPTQAADVFLSDTINPIDPSRPCNLEGVSDLPVGSSKLTDLSVAAVLTTSTIDGGPTTSKLIDSTASFTTAPAVEVGDTVVNTTQNTLATVTAVDSATQLSLSTNIMDSANEGYTIYTGEGFKNKVSIGDLVLNEATNTLTPVFTVKQTQLAFASDVFPTVDVKYKVYSNTSQMNSNTEPFVVYVSGSSDNVNIKVTTAAGNDIVFNGFPKGGFLPVQCLRVWSTDTTATNIVALW